MTNNQAEIEELLARRIGLDPVAVGPHLIVRAARRRMTELGLNDLSAYASYVGRSEVELQALIEEVVVPESWFFRDESPFRWMGDYVRERWLNDPSRLPLRVLSLPCAGGEEPYSIAMTLVELGLPGPRFRIDAVDVSAGRLAVARRGVYSANAFRGSELGWRARHFREHPQGYELEPAVRSTVRFLQASVLDPKLLEDSPPYDVVFCRNLLIYLDTPARARVLAALDRLLAADGVLVIGHADRLELAGGPPRFTAIRDPGCFAYRKSPRDARPARREGEAGEIKSLGYQDCTLIPIPVRAPLPPLGKGGLGGVEPASASQLPLAPAPDNSDPPWPPLTKGGKGNGPTPIIGTTESVEPLSRQSPAKLNLSSRQGAAPSSPARDAQPPTVLEQAAELANQGRHAEAIAACERHLRLKGPGAPAYYLMGMICQAAGDRRRAEDCFHKTVYLDPQHDEALLALALLAERRGDRDAAAGFRRRAKTTATATSTNPERGDLR